MDRVYRAKTLDGDGWVIGVYIPPKHVDTHQTHIIDTPTAMHIIDPETLGAYTGQNDRWNKPIFSGQKVRDQDGKIGTVVFRNAAYRISLDGFAGIYLHCNSSLLHCDRGISNRFELIGD